MSIRRAPVLPTHTGTGMSFNSDTGHIHMSANDILGMAHPFLDAPDNDADMGMIDLSGSGTPVPGGSKRKKVENDDPLPMPTEYKSTYSSSVMSHRLNDKDLNNSVSHLLKKSVIHYTGDKFVEKSYICIFADSVKKDVNYMYRDDVTASKEWIDAISRLALKCKEVVEKSPNTNWLNVQDYSPVPDLLKTATKAKEASDSAKWVQRLGTTVRATQGVPVTTYHPPGQHGHPRTRDGRHRPRGSVRGPEPHNDWRNRYNTHSGNVSRNRGTSAMLDGGEICSPFCQCEVPSFLDAPFKSMSLGAGMKEEHEDTYCQCAVPSYERAAASRPPFTASGFASKYNIPNHCGAGGNCSPSSGASHHTKYPQHCRNVSVPAALEPARWSQRHGIPHHHTARANTNNTLCECGNPTCTIKTDKNIR